VFILYLEIDAIQIKYVTFILQLQKCLFL